MNDNIRRATEYFNGDRFATDNGCVIEEIKDGYVRATMEIEDKHKNALGSVMGGAIFTLADFAFAVASNWTKDPCVMQNSQITFLSKAKGTRLIAEAECVKEGRSTCFYIVKVKDDLGIEVAVVTASGFVLRK